MTLQQLKYFIVIANSGSIGKAAERLFIAQPSLSNSLRELEAEFGLNLFSRTSKGTYLTQDGEEFLRYARQVIEQAALLEERWVAGKPAKPRLHIIAQHYAFAVKAFINMIGKNGFHGYHYSLQEGKAFDVIEEVKILRSDIGLLYKDRYNRAAIDKLLREGNLEFYPLFTAKPYVLISIRHPLAGREYLTPKDLSEYPRTSFERSDYNALYFSQEMEALSEYRPEKKEDDSVKSIAIGDRGTMLHLLLGINAYTLATGLQGVDMYGSEIIAVPFRAESADAQTEVGWISRKDRSLGEQAERYIEELYLVAAETKVF
jgi:DNA-binding transcriptional LysR family regulator